jgi:hypothetical protein
MRITYRLAALQYWTFDCEALKAPGSCRMSVLFGFELGKWKKTHVGAVVVADLDVGPVVTKTIPV